MIALHAGRVPCLSVRVIHPRRAFRARRGGGPTTCKKGWVDNGREYELQLYIDREKCHNLLWPSRFSGVLARLFAVIRASLAAFHGLGKLASLAGFSPRF